MQPGLCGWLISLPLGQTGAAWLRGAEIWGCAVPPGPALEAVFPFPGLQVEACSLGRCGLGSQVSPRALN